MSVRFAREKVSEYGRRFSRHSAPQIAACQQDGRTDNPWADRFAPDVQNNFTLFALRLANEMLFSRAACKSFRIHQSELSGSIYPVEKSTPVTRITGCTKVC